MNFAAEGYDWQVIHGKLLDNFEKKINMYSKNQKIPSVKGPVIKFSQTERLVWSSFLSSLALGIFPGLFYHTIYHTFILGSS